MVESLTIIKYY